MPHVRLPAADVTPGDLPSAIPPGKPGIGSDLDATVAQIGAMGVWSAGRPALRRAFPGTIPPGTVVHRPRTGR
jgi:hypothetical protein